MARRAFMLLALLASTQLIAACGDSDSPSAPSPMPRGEFSQTDLLVGSGATVVAGNLVLVNYAGWLYDPAGSENKGRLFGSGNGAGFQIGVGGVIRGWDLGVVGMRVGGRRRLVIPPELGYGSAGRPPDIPGNATLVFDIELLAVQ